ncbi:CRISPR-associated helicase/endonuclease Cas3 [Teredinibacter turnerae]|uniref:CRISPR-associated helicase/endonuclease Cas3 n=1 Tax=Teredinibacter turnerae TaxID=2426 RepID=UPI0003998D51|nr:CRISPR-associated helicase/endonuclease Cas3 [Teredinibacter turnerae]
MKTTDLAQYYRYWGKAKPQFNGIPYHLLPYHLLDVAAVGFYLLSPESKRAQEMAAYLKIPAEQLQSTLVFFLALHDLGKFASAFQGLYEDSSGALFRSKGRTRRYDGAEYRHDRLGSYFWQTLRGALMRRVAPEMSPRSIDKVFAVLIEIVLGHHGKPINKSCSVDEFLRFIDKAENCKAAEEFIDDVVELLPPCLPLQKMVDAEFIARLKHISWPLAGVAVIADWVGSDEQFFPYVARPMPLSEYWQLAMVQAQNAMAQLDLTSEPRVRPFISIKHHYGFEPTPLQTWAATVPVESSPQLFILEDVTGSGKTEAALTLAHRLMEAGAASGFYFGLPTMATSNAMFKRVATHYRQMLEAEQGVPSIVLAHGAREMSDEFREAVLAGSNPGSDYAPDDQTATAQCHQWLADSRKKALLAPVGVGTIDQALLAVLPRRHQSIRMLGLVNKVLIFDEVHAADEYMLELLESLLAFHLHCGGSAILLTATLAARQRARLVDVWLGAAGREKQAPKETAFPLATRVNPFAVNALIEQPLASRKDVSRSVAVDFVHEFEQCVTQVLQAVSDGQCVVWVRNSVDDALEAYTTLRDRHDDPNACLLFHSRFILHDRKRIEERVLSWFGKQSDGCLRSGKVLIATQVFQESLDADADLMISDICPIDDLIQRAGRLHRHTRDSLGCYVAGGIDARNPPRLVLHCPVWSSEPDEGWLSTLFRNTEFVYQSPGRLWLTQRVLRALGSIAMPGDARKLIEAVYSESAVQEIPSALTQKENELAGKDRAKAAKASAQLIKWQSRGYCDTSAGAWFEDNTDIGTRYNEIETTEVLLLKLVGEQLVPWVNDERHSLALSKVKLPKKSVADRLALLPEYLGGALANFLGANPGAQYLQCWLPSADKGFGYEQGCGFLSRNPRESGER